MKYGLIRKISCMATRHPLILGPKHGITRLIVMHHHLRLYCTSNKHVLNELRQKHWILKGLPQFRRFRPAARRVEDNGRNPNRLSWLTCPVRDWAISNRRSRTPVSITLAPCFYAMEERQKSATGFFLRA